MSDVPPARASEPVSRPELKDKLLSGLRWITVSRILTQVLTWANTFFVIRLLSPTDYGLAALAGVFSNFLALLNELGFSVTLVQRQTRDLETLRHVFGALLVISLILCGGLVLAAPVIGDLVKEPRVVPLLRFVSLQFIVMAFSVIPQAQLSMDLRFRELSVIGIVAALLGAAITLVMALHGAGAWSLIVGAVGIGITRCVLLNVFHPALHAPRLKVARIRPFAAFSGLVLLERTLWYWYVQLDSLLVGRFLGAAQLGIYAVGKQLTSIPLERAMEIINSIALPAFARVKTDPQQVRFGYLKILRLGGGYAFPVFWGLAAVSEPLVRVVLGTKWLPAVPVIRLLCISMPLRMVNSLTSAPATGVGRQDVNIKSLLVAIVVIPTAIAVGTFRGVTGVAAAWAIAFPLVYLWNAALIRRALAIPVRQMWSCLWPSALAAGLMSVATGVLVAGPLSKMSPLQQLAISVPVGGVVFLASLLAVSRNAARELLGFARQFSLGS